MKPLAFSNHLPYDYQMDKPVPRIVHFCWYGGKSGGIRRSWFRFFHFISILSAYKFIKPEVIYFWYDFIPEGDLWKDIRRRVPIIRPIHRPAPSHIYYRSVKVDAHQSDIVRLEAVMEYGGIYMDLDVVAVKSFDPLLKYDTTMGYQSNSGLCNGIIISKPNAPFLRLWHIEYVNFKDDHDWDTHSVRVPAKMAKIYPGLIHTEQKTLNRPNWYEARKWLYVEGQLYDWSNNYAVHLAYNSAHYKIEHSPESIKNLNTTMAEIFRYIYYGSKDFVSD
jgi:mannosyltransferase OCH1-like enzyme